MCGLTGFYDPRPSRDATQLARIVTQMRDALVHRGPDDAGEWVDADCGIALGFRRLSIIDLTATGHQPMVSASGRYVIVFNGEVYNYRDLQKELRAAGVHFRGGSDTEVVLEGFARWGIRETASRLNGMFAIALWDRETRTLTLLRDRAGIKPLYWGQQHGLFIFGSELKALRAHPGWSPQVDTAATGSFLEFGYIPAPHTIYQGVYKLEAGCMLTLRAGEPTNIEAYWRLIDTVAAGHRNPLRVSDGEAVEQLDRLLRDAVGRCMIADVPLGAFLSGGIDSSTVAALMQAQSSRPVRTFTIGFLEQSYNEAEHAKEIAQHLGTEHTEFTVEPAHARDLIPSLADMYDEPFGDSSQIPTYLLSKLTRRHVTVALSGDGGDELFAGYDRYAQARRIWQGIGWMPGPLRATLAASCRALSSDHWDQLLQRAPAAVRNRLDGARMHKAGAIFADGQADAIYRHLVTQWPHPEQILGGVAEVPTPFSDAGLARTIPDFGARMRYIDMMTYLPEDVLTKVDRASMATSLEARVPLLDHRVVDFAWRLPYGQLVRNGTSKWLLRKVLERYVPLEKFDRPKMGFGVPVGAWLRGPLRDWAEDLLSERSLRSNGLMPPPIRQYWAEHLAGNHNWQYPLWSVLMLQAWHRRWAATP